MGIEYDLSFRYLPPPSVGETGVMRWVDTQAEEMGVLKRVHVIRGSFTLGPPCLTTARLVYAKGFLLPKPLFTHVFYPFPCSNP
jgi:hypothetical protein